MITIVGLLGDDVHVRGYALETVVAEKGVTILERGSTSTRWRDYVDLVTIARRQSFTYDTLPTACQAVATARAIDLSPVRGPLSEYDDVGQSKWRAWRRKSGLESVSEEQLKDQLEHVALFLDPVFGQGDAERPFHWDPQNYRWNYAQHS